MIGPKLSPPVTAEEKTNIIPFNAKREIWLTNLGIVATIISSIMVGVELGGILIEQARGGHWGIVAAHSLFMVIVAFLIYGGFVYLFTRLAYLKRRMQHCPVPRDVLEAIYDKPAAALTILVPSYKEDERVVFQTLMSAALQEYPNRRVVLLIDDPLPPRSAADAAALATTCGLPHRIQKLFTLPAQRFEAALTHFEARQSRGPINAIDEAAHLISLCHEVAVWFEHQAQHHAVVDHADVLYVDKILLRQRDMHRSRAAEIAAAAQQPGGLHETLILREYRRLASVFKVEMSSFQRKAYVNLSHEANKAMNLNSYIGLVGQSWRERKGADGLHLEQVDASQASLHIPDADYFVTLDADSLIVPDYALRLVHLMEQPGNEKLAVAQTPYSCTPGASGVLERIAGATTDIQYQIHQGFTAYNATYWVGANAVLRKAALLEIAAQEEERGFVVTRYIQDRTVIEDTESTIDLVGRGWRLFNYPERLAYSATPPDFGSLLIQRRRWANGGLIILPKLLRYLGHGLGRGPGRHRKLMEGFMRFHYLTSIAAVNIGLLIVLIVPFTESIRGLWLPLTALPYFIFYARDLVLLGYRRTDIFRVYALNLLLLPVNMGGVLKSLQQAWTKEKIPFGRTPKIQGRTTAAALYVIAAYVLLVQWFVSAAIDFSADRWGHGVFAVLNAAFLLYAVQYFIGFKESKEDILAGVHGWHKMMRPKAKTAVAQAVPVAEPEVATPGCGFEVETKAGIPLLQSKPRRAA